MDYEEIVATISRVPLWIDLVDVKRYGSAIKHYKWVIECYGKPLFGQENNL